MAKKIKKKVEVPGIEPKISNEEQLLLTKRALCHQGEAAYHLITQLQIMNQTLVQLVEQGKKRNELLEEEDSEEEDSGEEEEEESEEEESEE